MQEQEPRWVCQTDAIEPVTVLNQDALGGADPQATVRRTDGQCESDGTGVDKRLLMGTHVC
jgi:hypothetical protein